MNYETVFLEFLHFTFDLLSKCGLISQEYPAEPQIVQLLCFLMFLVGALVFFILLFIPAVYGRYTGPKSWFGFGVDAKIAWFLQESPSFLVPLTVYLLEYRRGKEIIPNQMILAGLFVLHYWQRTFIYSFMIRGGKPTPVGICGLAFIFCSVNGYIQVRSIQLKHFDDAWLSNPIVILGITLYFIGLAINIHSDHILRSLRKPGEAGYKIPKGGLYNYVTAANYFGEALEWFGFLLAVQTLASAAFSFFTLANLLPRAIAHHRWYKAKFDDYPKDRKIFFPFLF